MENKDTSTSAETHISDGQRLFLLLCIVALELLVAGILVHFAFQEISSTGTISVFTFIVGFALGLAIGHSIRFFYKTWN